MPTFPKPEPRARTKRRKQRHEAAVIKDVRAACVERDGYCRLRQTYDVAFCATSGLFGRCEGHSEWAHFANRRRAKTRGMDPAERHTTAGSFMACRRHHADYDAHRLNIEAMTDRGCDGPLAFSAEGRLWVEEDR